MSERMSAKLVCDALQMAYWRRRPAIGLLISPGIDPFPSVADVSF